MPLGLGDGAASIWSDSSRSAPISLAKAARCSSVAIVRPTGYPAPHPERGQARLEPATEIPYQVGLADLDVVHAGVFTAVSRIEDEPLAQQSRARLGHGHHVAQ